MGQHYVPQFFLHGFGDQGRIWVYDKKERRSFCSRVKSVANETDMYGDELEAYLANKIEEPAKIALEKARSWLPLASQERQALAAYLVALWKRTPRGRDLAFERLPEAADDYGREIDDLANRHVAMYPQDAEKVASWRNRILNAIEDQVKSPSIDIWRKTIRSASGDLVRSALLNMHWHFLKTDKAAYLSSDNPVFFFAHMGVGRAQSELTVPLSSTVALWATRMRKLPAERMHARSFAVKEINRRTVASASRFVFAGFHEEWVLPLALKSGIRLNRIA